MRILFLSIGLVRLVACLPNGLVKPRQSMRKTADFPWPIDKDLEERPNVVKIRYGPYNIKANSEEEFFITKMKKPCDDCWITAFQGGLEYVNGTVANADTGAWLHHMVG